MSVGFDPQCPFDMSLECFADVPKEQRPVFTFRRTSGREYLVLETVWDDSEKRTSEVGDKLFDLVRIGLVGWRNQFNPETGEEVPYDPARLAEIIDHTEAFEIINRRLRGARLSNGEAKNFASQS